MYRERIPTAPKSIGRQAPVSFSSGPSFSFLRPVGRFLKTAVESLDPRFIASEGGRSVQHVVGDATELGRSIITGEDTLSESPTARAYQAAGGGAPGVLAAALPYVNVGTAVLPTTRVLTPAGRAAIGADAAERLAQKQILATVDRPPTVGVHVSPRSGLTEINPRVANQTQGAASDSLVGSSYMWDARSPQTPTNIFDNPQMADIAGLGETPSIYVTRPQGRVFADANVPMSSALRVAGPQEVLTQLPFDQQALSQYLESLGVSPRSATADRLEQAYRGLSPVVRQQVANRPNQMAEEALRTAIRMAGEGNQQYASLVGLDRSAPLDQLLASPEALRIYNEGIVRYGGTPTSRSGMFSLGAGRENVMIYQLGDQGQVQGALEMYPTPEGYVVQNLSAELGSPTVARLLAGAKLRAQAQYPGLEYPLAPSTNLSQYSRPLVEKLQAAGLVDPNFGLPAIDEINAIDLPYHAANPIDINDVPRLVPIQKQELQQTTKELIRALAQAKREGRINPDSVTRTTELRSQLAERQRQAAEDFFAPPAETMAQRSARLAEMQRQNTMRELAQFGDQLAEGSFPSGTAQLPSLVRTPAAWMPVLDDPYRQVMAMYEQGQIYNIEMLDDALAQAIPTFVQQYAPTAAGFTPVEQQVIGQQLWRMAPDFLTNVSTGWKTGELGQSLAEWRNSPRYRRPQSKY
jgi:hypothetical protein